MIDQQVEWSNNPNEASMWAMGWIEDVKTRSSHTGVRRIHEAAAKLRERFCCNGMWAPGAENVYNMLRESADIAQIEYEELMPGMEE